MNNLHGQGHPGPGQEGNLYGFGNSQDDFSTPFNNDGAQQQPGFTDPNSFLNSNFNSHFDQQMNTDTHDNLSTDFFPQNGQSSWPQSQFFDQSHLGNFQGIGDSASTQSFSNPYNSHLGAFNEIHDNSTFSNFPTQASFGRRVSPPRQQDSTMNTINPHAIQTPSDFVYQQPAANQVHGNMTSANNSQKAAAPGEIFPPHQHQQLLQHQHLPPQQYPQTTGPQRRFLDTDLVQAIDSALPQPEKQGWFSIRPRSQFKSPAEVQPLAKFPFINISKEAFDSAEARVIPPPRRIFWSVNELEQKLKDSPASARDPKTRSMLESKVSKARTRTKPMKGNKQRKLVPAVGPASAGAAKPMASVVEDVSDDSSSEASDDESEYVSDSDEVIEEEPSPLPSIRPDDPIKAREYDILKAVWARSAVRIGPDDVKRRMAAFLDIVKKVRLEWRAATTPEGAATKRKQFEQILRLTVKHGHHNFIESIDQLTPLASIIAAGLLELIKGNLYSDGLLEAILELVVKIPNIDTEFLKTTKLDRHKERFLKKTQGRIKDLASFIELPEANSAASKQADSVDVKAAPSAGGPSAMVRTSSAQSQGAKKTSEQPQTAIKKPSASAIDPKKVASSLNPVKKTPVVAVNKPAATMTNPTKTPAAPKTISTKTGEKPSAATSNGTATKPTIRQVAPSKAPSIFSSLTAAKKSGTSISATSKPAAAKPKTPEPKAAAAAPPPKKPAFSFSDMLANVGKPKEEPKKAESKEQRPPETEEERKKRLRKEERRKLRVTWKPDHELEAVRIFDHKQDDETMHDAMDVADAADLKSEGQAFKRQLRRDHVSGVEPEDEEEQEYIDWFDPRLTDFSSIYERKAGDYDPPPQNVETRAGGSTKFTSAESEVQQKREQGVMIEMYQSLRDVPPHPKEPADPFNGKSIAQYDFGAIENCGTNPPVPARLADRNKQLLRQYGHQSNAAQQPAPQANGDISSILAMLGQGQSAQTAYQPPQQQYAPAQPADPIASLLAQFNGSQTPAPAPQPASNPYQDAINLFNSMQGGGQVPAAPMPSVPQPAQQQASASTDLTSILASLAAGSGQQPTPAPPAAIPVPPQPQAPAENMPAGFDPSLLGWLTQYNANNTGAAPPQPQPNSQGNWSNYGNSSGGQAASATDWLQQLNGTNTQGNGNGTQSNTNERKRGYEDDHRNDGGGKKKQKKIPFTGVPFLVCRYYKEGRCQKGSECTFLHE